MSKDGEKGQGRKKGSRKQALERAEGQCEVQLHSGGRWRRCPGWGTDVHHMLPRSRGGTILDQAWESYHLVVLCREHHQHVHAHPNDARLGMLTIDGFVVRGPDGRPRYQGTDVHLMEKYGDESEEPALGRPADHATPRPLAGPTRRRPATSWGGSLGSQPVGNTGTGP